jgi:rubrerythrin
MIERFLAEIFAYFIFGFFLIIMSFIIAYMRNKMGTKDILGTGKRVRCVKCGLLRSEDMVQCPNCGSHKKKEDN